VTIYDADVSCSNYIIYSFINNRMFYNGCHKTHEKKLPKNFVILAVRDLLTITSILHKYCVTGYRFLWQIDIYKHY
jgi:hypothetical protein